MFRKFFNSLLFVFVLCSADAVLADAPPPEPPPKTPTTPTHTPEQIQAIIDENRRLKDEADKRNKKDDDDDEDEDDKDLTKKVKQNREAEDKRQRESKGLEAALRFNLTSDKFISEHKSILPKDMADISAAAEKENYESPVEKANATKAALIQSFFNLQANVDMLTPSQRDAIEDFNKLTSKGRQEKAHEIYQNIFEPTLGMLKQIKKAEELGKAKGNYPNESEGDTAYREKLMAGSRKHFLGEKEK